MAVNLYGFQHEILGSVLPNDFRSAAISVLKLQLYQLVDSYFLR